MKRTHRLAFLAIFVTGLALGCTEAETPSGKSAAKRGKESAADTPDSGSADAKAKKFQPVQLGSSSGEAGQTAAKKKIPDEKRAQVTLAALQPFQVLLGDWRWNTRKLFGNFAKAAEDMKWVWDFQSDPNRPALKGTSDANPYFQKVWLTWLPDDEKFQLTGKTPDGEARVLQGAYVENGEPKEESDGKKLQHTYKLQLTQVTPAEGEQWQVTLTQVDNNQYRMDLTRRPPTGKQFGPLDSVHHQRFGTSFAVADSDNPGPKCIISGGLGTIQVEYKGKSYPVCCSGCAAAFKDDPEKWLAKFAEKQKAMNNNE